MAAEVVQLSNSHGRRYSAAEKEAAYQAWRIAAGRSLRRTAELTGIAHGTLGNWSKDDGWQERARREDREEAESVREALHGIITGHAIRSIETAAKLRDDESGKTPPKVRLDAAVWLAGLAGVVPVQKSQVLEPAPPPAEKKSLDYFRGLTSEERSALRDGTALPDVG